MSAVCELARFAEHAVERGLARYVAALVREQRNDLTRREIAKFRLVRNGKHRRALFLGELVRGRARALATSILAAALSAPPRQGSLRDPEPRADFVDTGSSAHDFVCQREGHLSFFGPVSSSPAPHMA
jgi:hypothetical protein